jgi:hypothetical protein
MDLTRCPICTRRLMAVTDQNGSIELSCLKCDGIDPMKTDAAKWADSPLARPPKDGPTSDQVIAGNNSVSPRPYLDRTMGQSGNASQK